MTVIVYAHNIESPLALRWYPPHVLSGHLSDFLPLVSIHRRLRSFHAVRCSGFNLNKTKYIVIPRDQVDLTMTARRAEVSRHDHIPEPAQVEVSVFFPANTRALVHRPPIGGQNAFREPVQTSNDDSSESGGQHNDCFRLRKEQIPGCDLTHIEGYFRKSNLKNGKMATDDANPPESAKKIS
jgi:hypothetical protein